jgi:ribosomal protein L44E
VTVDEVDDSSDFVQTRSGVEMELTRRLRVPCKELIAGWFRPLARVEAEVHQKQDMRWTCPDCRLRHETIIDPHAEAGKIVEVNCRACGAQHEASVFFRRQGSGKANMTIGVVWL